ncbi:transposase [Streptomyces griseus]|uniref:transposase n=1 Tax=Streptomyces griseus TaxID=1911 RepID=UPI00068E8EC1|nr:transposase [Streptomyces griseus]
MVQRSIRQWPRTDARQGAAARVRVRAGRPGADAGHGPAGAGSTAPEPAAPRPAPPEPDGPEGVVPAWFMDAVFGSLAGAGQRRCARLYLEGLLGSCERKTVRSMTSCTSDLHAVQRFLNQSPWDWQPVREALSDVVEQWTEPKAFVVDLAVIPRYGDRIVGVHRRSDPAGGSVNCQIALGASCAGRDRTVPVDWYLYLNRAWGEDEEHRRRGRIPAGARQRPVEELALRLADKVSGRGRTGGVPVVLDLRGAGNTERAAAGLLERGTGFLLSLGAADRLRPGALRPPSRGPLVTVASPASLGLPGAGRRRFSFLVEWSPARDRPRKVWLTNLLDGTSDDFLALLRYRAASGTALAALREDYGMGDFTGRSFSGWHHHMTLLSAAYALSTLELAGPV